MAENKYIVKSLVLFFCLCFTHSCDRFNKKKCQWLIFPEIKSVEELRGSKLDSKWLPICVRNIESNKQSCEYVTTLDVAKQFSKERFRFNDLVWNKKDKRYPKKITAIRKNCP